MMSENNSSQLTTNLTVLDTSIRQLDGLYSLDDLHKASGGSDKHHPALYIGNDKTKEAIEEIKPTELQVVVKTSKGGSNPGIWACKEFLYSYASWVSPKFHFAVIRAFDSLANCSGQINDQHDDLEEKLSCLPPQYAAVYKRFPQTALDLVFVNPTSTRDYQRTGHKISWWSPPRAESTIQDAEFAGLLCALDLAKLATVDPDEARKALKFALMYCGNSIGTGYQGLSGEESSFCYHIANMALNHMLHDQKESGHIRLSSFEHGHSLKIKTPSSASISMNP